MKNKWKLFSNIICVAVILMASTAFCTELFVYPAKGQSQNQAANYDQQLNNFNRAYQGCLEGRGYSVK